MRSKWLSSKLLLMAIIPLLLSPAGVFFPANTALAAPSDAYTMTDLGTLGGATSSAYAINGTVQVVGQSDLPNGQTHAFLWHGGVMTDLGTLGGGYSSAAGINNNGQVVGAASLAGGENHAFLWQNGVMTDLGTLGGTNSYAQGINTIGQIVGFADLSNGESHAFLWQNGGMTDLGTLGGNYSAALGINNSGQIVGWADTGNETHAVLWQNGSMTDLGTLGGDYSAALGINNSGQIVGQSHLPNGQVHAYRWQDSAMTDLGALAGGNSWAEAINESGQIIGYADLASGNFSAVLWQASDMTEIGTLGGDQSVASDINANGQIVGTADLANGQRHAFLAKPTPPTTAGSSCTISGILVEMSSPSAAGSVRGTGCNVTLMLTNGQNYWTNYASDTQGYISYYPQAGDDLFADLNLLAPGMTLHFRAHFATQDDAVIFVTDPGLPASALNVITLLLDLVPGGYAGTLSKVGATATPQILQALPQMTDIQDLAVALAAQDAGIPSQQAILASLNKFAHNQAEQRTFTQLLVNISVTASEEVATTAIEHAIDFILSATGSGKFAVLAYKINGLISFYSNTFQRTGKVEFAPVNPNDLSNFRSPQTLQQIGSCFTQNRRSLQQNTLQACGLLNGNGLTMP